MPCAGHYWSPPRDGPGDRAGHVSAVRRGEYVVTFDDGKGDGGLSAGAKPAHASARSPRRASGGSGLATDTLGMAIGVPEPHGWETTVSIMLVSFEAVSRDITTGVRRLPFMHGLVCNH